MRRFGRIIQTIGWILAAVFVIWLAGGYEESQAPGTSGRVFLYLMIFMVVGAAAMIFRQYREIKRKARVANKHGFRFSQHDSQEVKVKDTGYTPTHLVKGKSVGVGRSVSIPLFKREGEKKLTRSIFAELKAAGFGIFQKGFDQNINSIYEIPFLNDAELWVFESNYRYRVRVNGKRKTRSRKFPTVAIFSPNLSHTEFYCRPVGAVERVRDQVAESFGREDEHDIEILYEPDFSKRFYLSGPDRDAVQQLFNSDLIRFLEEMPRKYTVTLRDQTLLIYIEDSLGLDEKELLRLIEQGKTLYPLLT